MRVLQFGKFFPPDMGGIENFIHDLVERLSQSIECDVLCSNSRNKTVVESKKNYSITRVASLGKIFSTSISPKMIYWLKKIGNNYNLVHLHMPDPMANLAYFLVRPKTKLIVHWHSDIVKQKKLLKLYEPLQEWLFKKADRIIATSPNYIEGSSCLKRYKEKCIVIPLGLNLEALRVDKKKVEEIRNLIGNKPILFSLGRLIYYKGFDYLIKAMKNIDACLLIGGDGPLKEKLQKYIESLGLNKKVFLLGKIERKDIGSYYQACELFCLPSVHKSEAFGLVQLEAMYFGKPIVSTDIKGSGVGWVNRNNVSGKVVPARNSKALSMAINEILGNQALKKKLGENGKLRFDENFRIEIVANKILKLYNEIIYAK